MEMQLKRAAHGSDTQLIEMEFKLKGKFSALPPAL